ncbi:MAG: tRNA uridine-5-carboxymethylaminomethyl(34) synthesis GTPase MnmE [Candidatus Omnitrophica bacterium]|nr:tRNA uridine-5-carboxymethylaminomethyl(34) synthesis GTPase MnmE [Candidatus Omnitrophota bacterium]
MHNNKDTIVAISTAVGEGAIGIVRLSGSRAVAIAQKMFVPKSGNKISGFKSHTVHYGHIVRYRNVHKGIDIRPAMHDARTRRYGIIDEVLLTLMRGPRTYTREDVVEISCHGGIVPLKKVMEEAVHRGARPADPGEFTKRAFLNGRIDLAQAEGVQDVIRAKTEAAFRVALSHLEGDFSRGIKKLRAALMDILRVIEADIDFQEEHQVPADSDARLLAKVGKVRNRLDDIVAAADTGRMIQEGITCVICGKPNVGKSSLLNAFLKRNRAIVTPVPGTTRDVIEDVIAIGGVPVRLVDTAGIQPSRNVIEKIGIRKSREYIKKADIIIFMLDFSRPFDDNDLSIIKLLPQGRIITVANKCDLKRKLHPEAIPSLAGRDIVPVSAKERKNIAVLEQKLSAMIWQGKVHMPEHDFITSIRQAACVRAALKSVHDACSLLKHGGQRELLAVDIRQAVFELGKVTGEAVDVNILDRIFAKFCIGK